MPGAWHRRRERQNPEPRHVIKDHGAPFDPTEHEDADVEAELQDRPIGGLGIYLVKSIMDSMTYERSADGYNILTLTKNISEL